MAILRTIACLAVFAAAAPALALAAPKSPDAAMMAPINAVAKGVDAGKAPAMTYSESAVVVDEFAPYVWKGAGSGPGWFSAFAAFEKQHKITQTVTTLQAVKNFDSMANAAYIVVPTIFTGKWNGKPFRETGLWTFTLTKRGSKWLIASQSWATQSMSM